MPVEDRRYRYRKKRAVQLLIGRTAIQLAEPGVSELRLCEIN